MKRTSTMWMLASAGLLLAVSAPVKAGPITIFSENFDELGQHFTQTAVGIFHTLNSTNVDVIGPSWLCVSPESGSCVDLNGSGTNAVGQLELTTAVNLAPGTYTLNFDLIGSQRKSQAGATDSTDDTGVQTTTTVSLGSAACSGVGCLYTQVFTLANNDDSTGVVSTNIVIGAQTNGVVLRFVSDTPGLVGALLDNVSLVETQQQQVTPEPGTFVLLGSALLGLGGLGRLRSRRASR